jgi:predicted DNA-binding protein
MPRIMTLRLTDEQAATLDAVARADDQTVTEAVRTAIDAHIEERRQDKDFKERLLRRHEEERALYERLSK